MTPFQIASSLIDVVKQNSILCISTSIFEYHASSILFLALNLIANENSNALNEVSQFTSDKINDSHKIVDICANLVRKLFQCSIDIEEAKWIEISSNANGKSDSELEDEMQTTIFYQILDQSRESSTSSLNQLKCEDLITNFPEITSNIKISETNPKLNTEASKKVRIAVQKCVGTFILHWRLQIE